MRKKIEQNYFSIVVIKQKLRKLNKNNFVQNMKCIKKKRKEKLTTIHRLPITTRPKQISLNRNIRYFYLVFLNVMSSYLGSAQYHAKSFFIFS